ncbi:type II toxin-antitoxin system RelE/ParE family toxin [Streptomyces sp. NPDC101175]|uniref:type II toxin-antitoxin system RelE family toxin n=1 Tax=Streptomyces sp. NPDC101175 TaxID=3366123 RepID=UPI003835998D
MSYEVRISPAAESALAALPYRIGTAAVNFMQRELRERPYEVGLALRGGLGGHLVARRGQYRIVYSVNTDAKTIDIVHVTQH